MKLKLLCVLLSLWIANAALGSTIIYCTPGGVTLDSNPVGGCVSFMTASGELIVDLVNTVDNPLSAGQGINAFDFVLGNGLTATALTSSVAMSIDIALNKSYVENGLLPTGWLLSRDGLGACALCPHAIGPAGLLLGAPAADGTYADANRSIAGNGPHNPFRNGVAQFIFEVPGMTENSPVLGATLYFSTTDGLGVPAHEREHDPPAPEPATLTLVGASLLSLGAFRYRRRQG